MAAKHILVCSYNGYWTGNAEASIRAAGKRWGAQVHVHEPAQPPAGWMRDRWKFEGPALNKLPDDDIVLMLDADVIYRYDAPSPFDYYAPMSIGAASDIQRVDTLDGWGHVMLDHLERWELMTSGVGRGTTVPLNSGVLLASAAMLRSAGEWMLAVTNEQAHRKMFMLEQCALAVACRKFGIPVNVLPDWVNELNLETKYGFLDGPMPAFSAHLAGYDFETTTKIMSRIEWQKRRPI